MEYADDASLCASSPKQLQDLINSFVAYCDKHGLTVNPKKCEVVLFAKSCRAWSARLRTNNKLNLVRLGLTHTENCVDWLLIDVASLWRHSVASTHR
jgi:hypothetical protein